MSTFIARLRRFLRLLSGDFGCAHERLVFDDFNDVHCACCRKDFSG